MVLQVDPAVGHGGASPHHHQHTQHLPQVGVVQPQQGEEEHVGGAEPHELAVARRHSKLFKLNRSNFRPRLSQVLLEGNIGYVVNDDTDTIGEGMEVPPEEEGCDEHDNYDQGEQGKDALPDYPPPDTPRGSGLEPSTSPLPPPWRNYIYLKLFEISLWSYKMNAIGLLMGICGLGM